MRKLFSCSDRQRHVRVRYIRYGLAARSFKRSEKVMSYELRPVPAHTVRERDLQLIPRFCWTRRTLEPVRNEREVMDEVYDSINVNFPIHCGD